MIDYSLGTMFVKFRENTFDLFDYVVDEIGE